MRLRVARSARHKIGNTHILEALLDAGDGEVEPGTDEKHYYGRDARGRELHIVTTPARNEGNLTIIIHAMPTAMKE